MTRCKENIFIFDEVDKMPPGVLDIVKPFMDYYEVGPGENNIPTQLLMYLQHIDGVDYRHNIFIFLSNTGGRDITGLALNHWNSGKKREVSS